MILIYLVSAIAAIIAYLFTAKLNKISRIAIVLLIFGVPSVLTTAFVFFIGDKAPPNAVTVQTKTQ